MEKIKTCSFIGHRKIQDTTSLRQSIENVIEDLIVNHGVLTFLFGSRSEFDRLCHQIVAKLKIKYSGIKRVLYTCCHEQCILESNRKHLQDIYSSISKSQTILLGYEEEFEHKTKYLSGKASYVERNQAMINDSDFCVFYFDKNYLPPKIRQKGIIESYSQPKSGTRLALEYAIKKDKKIINLYHE